MFNLRFDKREIEYWASRYDYPLEPYIADTVAPRVKKVGYISREDFLAICDWKTSRTRKHVGKNREDFIHEVTRVAFSTPNERLRIELLTLLKGVSWPTASVILHFCHTEPYPIIDFRALWSLGVEADSSKYDFDLWLDYTCFCRNIAADTGVSMRALDKALWQFSKVNQGKTTIEPSPPTRKIVDSNGAMVSLPYGGKGSAFSVDDLIRHIGASGHSYIIQGGVACSFASHPKHQSLDYWLRQNYTDRKDTMQAVAEVIDALVASGKFVFDEKLECPDSGRHCKGIRLVLSD
jgi:hypothetical protein